MYCSKMCSDVEDEERSKMLMLAIRPWVILGPEERKEVVELSALLHLPVSKTSMITKIVNLSMCCASCCECSKTSFKDSFPLLYKAAEELDAAVGEGLLSDNDLAILEKGLSSTMTEEEIKRCKKGLETTLHMKKEFNELVHSKRAFKLSSSGFCVTLSGPGEATGVLCSGEADGKRGDCPQRKAKMATKMPEIRTRMRKTLEGRHTEVVTSKSCTVNIQQAKIQIYDDLKPTPVDRTKKSEENGGKVYKSYDVDELVQIIEGTHIKSGIDPNPKKAAKKARQKEKKEQERQRQQEEKAKEEEDRKAEEIRRLEEEKRKEEQERRRLEEEEQRKKDEIIRKQRELAEQKKEEQRKKRQEVERKKAEEKKQKKEAKKQRREQRKKDMEEFEDDGSEKKSVTNESFTKTDYANDKDGSRTPSIEVVSEKEYGRLKHEKEQRKREEEEARRMEQLQAQERSQANKKNKKKKKKSKQTDGQGQNAADPNSVESSDNPELKNTGAVGQPLIEILSSSKSNESPGRGTEEKNNLVTIKKHMDSSVTISMKGKEGESDLVYTLMNGQVYPTSVDGKIRSEAPLPLQHTTFVKQQDNIRPNHVAPMPNPVNHCNSNMGNVNPVKSPIYQAPPSGPNFLKESSSMAEIDLSQLKLPPGITITKVPQQMSGPRCEDMNGVQNVDYHSRAVGQPNMHSEYHRSGSVGVVENRHNSNIMVVDSRCSSLESPVIGIRPSEMAFGANGTRPSSEASVASDRPSSGLDSLCNNNGSSPYVSRQGFPSTEMLNKRVPIALSSPFAAASRNETPSPGWQNDVHPHLSGMPGMINHNNSAAADRHGFWSSTPASPVAFPAANPVSESYLRAQDQQFIRPRPQQRGVYPPPIGKRTSPSSGMCTDGNLFARKAHSTDFKPIGGVATNASPQYNHGGHISVNGSTTPSNLGPIGYKPVIPPCQPKPIDQWTPWNLNADRMSPDVHPIPMTPQYVPQEIPFSLNRILSDDINGPWESTPIEKPASRSVNPFGPIGSNITRRPSNATSNGIHGKISESSGSEDASMWAYNRTF